MMHARWGQNIARINPIHHQGKQIKEYMKLGGH